MRYIKILNDIISTIRSKKEYYLHGIIIFTMLFILSTILNFDFSYMGNKSEKLLSVITEYYLIVIILQVLKIFIFYLIAGIIFNFIFYIAIKEIQKRFKPFKAKEDFYILLFTYIGVLFYIFLIFSKKIIQNPQLYTENFAAHSGLFKGYLSFLTDSISPVIFDFIISAIFILILVLILISIDWEKILERLFNVKDDPKRVNLKVIFLLITLACTGFLLYKNGIIFYNKSNDKPNILIISSDALRPDHLSFNGYRKKTTPNIDVLAKDALQIRGTFTALPRTFPAWVSIFTSKYPITHGINHMFPRTRERNMNFNSAVDFFNCNGYKTAVISDFAGDIFPRINLGFKKVIAPEMNTAVLIKQMLLEKQTFLLPFITNNLGLIIFPEIRDFTKLSFSAVLTEETLNEINSTRGDPFFIVTFYSITHFPYSAPYPYYKKFTDPGYKGQHKYFKDRLLQLDNSDKNPGSFSREVDDSDKVQVNALYDGCLNLFDNEVGKIVKYLKKKNILNNTIIIITSDHGENLYEKDFGMGHGEHLKGNFSLEVPLIICYPKLANKGKSIEVASSAIDIMPTIFDVAGLKIPENFDGISILQKSGNNLHGGYNIDAYCETGMWFDNDKSSSLFFHHQRIDYPDITGVSEIDFNYKDEVVISQRYQNIVNGAKYRAIYSGKYKLIYIPLAGGPKFELYDYLADPNNETDLSTARKDVLDIMKKNFYDFIDKKSSWNFIIKNGIIFPAFLDPVF
jgi:arylsulfatase A-like enzyme